MIEQCERGIHMALTAVQYASELLRIVRLAREHVEPATRAEERRDTLVRISGLVDGAGMILANAHKIISDHMGEYHVK